MLPQVFFFWPFAAVPDAKSASGQFGVAGVRKWPAPGVVFCA